MPQPEYLDTPAVSELTGISQSTLEKWRVYGGGIPFIKARRSVKYALEDVRAWMADRRRSSTSEAPLKQHGAGGGAGHASERSNSKQDDKLLSAENAAESTL
jgi:predicted DNA-binding transcriptional regulator AlpA